MERIVRFFKIYFKSKRFLQIKGFYIHIYGVLLNFSFGFLRRDRIFSPQL
jgi:hypothetical protein